MVCALGNGAHILYFMSPEDFAKAAEPTPPERQGRL